MTLQRSYMLFNVTCFEEQEISSVILRFTEFDEHAVLFHYLMSECDKTEFFVFAPLDKFSFSQKIFEKSSSDPRPKQERCL